MCRIVAYHGPALRLSAVLREAPHSLEHQSRDAREMSDSKVAGDGWGVGWFPAEGPPGLIKSVLPMWSCENAKTATAAIASASFVGHIRLASPAIETCYLNTPLFVFGDHLFTVNGELKPWPGALSRALRARLDDEDEAALRGSTDAEMIGALWHTCLRRRGDPAGALREALRQAREEARALGGTVKVNALVSGRWGFVAARHADEGEPNSLYCLTEQTRWGGGALVASEPLDAGPGWKAVAPSSLVRSDAEGLTVEPLAVEGKRARAPRASA